MGTVDEFLQDDLDDEKTIEFIKNTNCITSST